MGKGVATFIVIAVLGLIMILIYQFGMMSVASSDVGVNLSGTTYQPAYNQSGNTSRVAFAAFGWAPVFLGVLALVFALLLIMAAVPKR